MESRGSLDSSQAGDPRKADITLSASLAEESLLTWNHRCAAWNDQTTAAVQLGLKVCGVQGCLVKARGIRGVGKGSWGSGVRVKVCGVGVRLKARGVRVQVNARGVGGAGRGPWGQGWGLRLVGSGVPGKGRCLPAGAPLVRGDADPTACLPRPAAPPQPDSPPRAVPMGCTAL